MDEKQFIEEKRSPFDDYYAIDDGPPFRVPSELNLPYIRVIELTQFYHRFRHLFGVPRLALQSAHLSSPHPCTGSGSPVKKRALESRICAHRRQSSHCLRVLYILATAVFDTWNLKRNVYGFLLDVVVGSVAYEIDKSLLKSYTTITDLRMSLGLRESMLRKAWLKGTEAMHFAARMGADQLGMEMEPEMKAVMAGPVEKMFQVEKAWGLEDMRDEKWVEAQRKAIFPGLRGWYLRKVFFH